MHDQRLFLKRPRTYLSNRRKLIRLYFPTWLSPTNQYSIIIQACNPRNHETFQLTDIFPFTYQCPSDYTRFFHNHHYLYFFYYHNGKIRFELFASPYIIHHIHEYRLSLALGFRIPVPPLFLGHSPDSGCVGAQRIMFLGRFLVHPTHLLPGGPRLSRIWFILDLARNRCPDSENQDTIDNSLWWRYLYFEWQQLSGGFGFSVPSLCNNLLDREHIHHTNQSSGLAHKLVQ